MVLKPGRSCRKIYGTSRPSVSVASVMILGIRWYDFVRNAEVIVTTNLPSVQDIITKRRNSLFGQVLRLDDHTPAHRALSQVAAVRTDTREYSRPATVPLSASTLDGPWLPIVGIPG